MLIFSPPNLVCVYSRVCTCTYTRVFVWVHMCVVGTHTCMCVCLCGRCLRGGRSDSTLAGVTSQTFLGRHVLFLMIDTGKILIDTPNYNPLGN